MCGTSGYLEPMKVLVAVDETEASWDAAVFTGELFDDHDEVVVVNVFVPATQMVAGMGAGGMVGFPSVGFDMAVGDVAANVEAMKKRLQPAAAAAGASDIVIEEGSVVEGLRRAAAEMEADLLVVGNRDRGWLRGLLSPSVSQNLASTAPCPVLIVRPFDRD